MGAFASHLHWWMMEHGHGLGGALPYLSSAAMLCRCTNTRTWNLACTAQQTSSTSWAVHAGVQDPLLVRLQSMPSPDKWGSSSMPWFWSAVPSPACSWSATRMAGIHYPLLADSAWQWGRAKHHNIAQL